ncbi:hypothetical protein GCM10010390_37210 [Streptomyces mordarskii]|uniref:Uncharacterized protein n=1 Tax=Streptomyces mordarskii TaxID=1226758 RepID=A0ABP3N2I4_9ACTN
MPFASGQHAQVLAAQGLLEPIHHDPVPHLKNLDPRTPGPVGHPTWYGRPAQGAFAGGGLRRWRGRP